MESSHPTRLMDWVFEPFSEGSKANVLHLGKPLPETVNTFTNYRCKIHVADAYSKLPFLLTNSNILDTFDIYQNTEIPKPFTQEEKILDKERNEEILSCKEKILNYMKTKMSEDRRRILSLLASQQYGLKEISELLKMDYGKVRKERSFAKKELREAFPECYKILEKKG